MKILSWRLMVVTAASVIFVAIQVHQLGVAQPFRSHSNIRKSTDYRLQESLCDPNPLDPPEDWVRLGIDISNREQLWKTAKNNSASWLVGNFEDEGDHMLSPFSWQAAHARIQMDMMTGQIPANFIAYDCRDIYRRGWGDRLKSAMGLYKVALLMGWGYLLDIAHPLAPDTQYPDHSFLNSFIPKYLFWNNTPIADRDMRYMEDVRSVQILSKKQNSVWEDSERDKGGFPKFSTEVYLGEHWGDRIVNKDSHWIEVLKSNASRLSSSNNTHVSGLLAKGATDSISPPMFLRLVLSAFLPQYELQLEEWNKTAATTDEDLRYRMLVTQIWSKLRLMLANMKQIAERDIFQDPPVTLELREMHQKNTKKRKLRDYEASYIGRRHDLMAETCVFNTIFEPTKALSSIWNKYMQKIQPEVDVVYKNRLHFPTESDMTSFSKSNGSQWLTVGLHIRAGDNAGGDRRFADREADEFWSCLKTTVEDLTQARCKESCPWKGVLVVSSSDGRGRELIKTLAAKFGEADSTSLREGRSEGNNTTDHYLEIGPNRKRASVRFVDLADLSNEPYVHVARGGSDPGYKAGLKSLSEMLTLGSCQILIRGESGFNYLAQVFGGIDSSFTSTVSVLHPKQVKKCSFQMIVTMSARFGPNAPLLDVDPNMDDDNIILKAPTIPTTASLENSTRSPVGF